MPTFFINKSILVLSQAAKNIQRNLDGYQSQDQILAAEDRQMTAKQNSNSTSKQGLPHLLQEKKSTQRPDESPLHANAEGRVGRTPGSGSRSVAADDVVTYTPLQRNKTVYF